MLTIFVVSDATGETAEWVVRSALIQFQNAPAKLARRGHIRSLEQVWAVVEEAAQCDALLLHTLVSDELRRVMLEECRLRGVDSMDMMGPLLDRLTRHLKSPPQERPGLLRQVVEAKSREIEAVDFTFRHDDGRNVEDLDRAEVVLVGVSRTMKTPTALYLAYRGWFAANVPIVPGVDPPETLLRVPPQRVFCLLMSPGRLLDLRRVRAGQEGIPTDPYASPEHVRAEILYARQLCQRSGWREIEVTSKSVEEVGQEIIHLLPSKGLGRTTAE